MWGEEGEFEEGRPRRGNTFVSESRRSIDFRRVGEGRRPKAVFFEFQNVNLESLEQRF